MSAGTLTRRRFLAVTASAMAAGSGVRAGGGVRDTWRGRALGAEAQITVEGPPEAVAAALPRAVAALRRAERLWSLHDPESALARLNTAGHLAAPDPAMGALLEMADMVHRLTDGLFDPTVQPLWHALAIGAGPEEVARARALVGWERVRFGADAVRLGTGQAMTLNGIAQGAAADLVVVALRAAGLPRALVDTGEAAGFGAPWQIGIFDPAQGFVGTRRLDTGAIATSSPGALRLGAESHILSRDAKAPLWSSVTVEAGSATLADALSTAACLMPMERLRHLRARAPGLRRITVVDGAGDLRSL